jgi:acyl-coenzyme A thioesterase PaaI-like protein
MPTSAGFDVPFDVSRDVVLDEGWAIGAMFGGSLARTLATAAVVASARKGCAAMAGDQLLPVSTSVVFLRPAAPGAATIGTTLVRAGRRYSTVSCAVKTDAGVAATALVTLAPRGSLSLLTEAHPTNLPPKAENPGGLSNVSERVDWRSVDGWREAERPEIEWPGTDRTSPFRSWIRVLDDDPLDPGRYLVASDLAGPALAAAGVALPFRIATVALSVEVVALTASRWLEQRLSATVLGDLAVVRLDLHDPAGALVATATQRAVVLPATNDELPWSVTAFGWG